MEGSLVTQGSMDWVALSKSTVNVSLEMLARYSKSGVEMITIAVGQALCNSFSLPADGQKRLEDALSKLKAFSSCGTVLWFGFGVKHIARTLFETEQGATFLGLCACLSVCYDSMYIAKVLKAICDSTSAPTSLKPSVPQWVGLVEVCAGAVTASEFGHLVDGLVRILGSWKKNPADCRKIQEPTSPQALGVALLELAKVSKGSLRSVTFTGGLDLGWVAAVAQWLFSMRVEIVDTSGNCLYKPSKNVGIDYAQIVVIYQDREEVKASNTRLVSRSYYVPPGKAKRFELFQPPQHYFSSGRSKWSTILNDVFNEGSERLLSPEHAEPLAIFLCWGMRRRLSWEYPQSHLLLGRNRTVFNEQTCRAFLKFSETRLPELSSSLELAQRTIFGQKDWQETQTIPRTFTKFCGCQDCLLYLAGDLHIPHHRREESKWCLERMANVIFQFLWMLLELDIDDTVQPSANGLLLLHESRGVSNVQDDYSNKMFEVIQLLTGLAPSDMSRGRDSCAVSSNGICVYISSFDNPAGPPSEQVRNRVLPGQIESNGVIYKAIGDVELKEYDMANSRRDEPFLPLLSTFGSQPAFDLILDETVDPSKLDAMYIVSPQDSSSSQPVRSIVSGESVSFPASKISKWAQWLQPSSCLRETIEVTIPEYSNTQSQTWTGQCSFAESALWRNVPELKSLLPQPNEWILTFHSPIKRERLGIHDKEITDDYPPRLDILRAPLALLYSVLFRSNILHQYQRRRIVQVKHCLMCLTNPRHLYPFNFYGSSEAHPLGLTVIHSFFDDRLESVQLLSHAKRIV